MAEIISGESKKSGQLSKPRGYAMLFLVLVGGGVATSHDIASFLKKSGSNSKKDIAGALTIPSSGVGTGEGGGKSH